MSEPKEIILLQEGLIESVASDLATVGILAAGVWFNHAFVGSSIFFNFVIGVLFFLWCIGRAKGKMKRFTSREKLIEYLSNHPAQAAE